MTDDELDKARAKEAWRVWEGVKPSLCEDNDVALFAARLAREGWTPPKPVDPDVVAYREWEAVWAKDPINRAKALAGEWDHYPSAKAFVAGARMARERAQVVSDALVEALDDYGNWDYWDKELRQIIDNYKAGKEATQ